MSNKIVNTQSLEFSGLYRSVSFCFICKPLSWLRKADGFAEALFLDSPFPEDPGQAFRAPLRRDSERLLAWRFVALFLVIIP